MKYNISVKKFLRESSLGNIDYNDFSAKLMAETKKINKLNIFQCLAKEKNKEQSRNLYGLPISVKDCICTKGMQSSAGSKILEGYVPNFDATAVERIKEESGFILGKTNQDEFGFGTFSVNSGYGIPKNPLDKTRSCGGSSGGAAAAVAAMEMPHISLAESTGGSISCPASFCGVVGLTPTYGLVSRYGLIDYSNSLDKIGPIGKNVHDVSLLLSIISGKDERDSTSHGKQKDYTKHLSKDMKKVRIAVPKEYFKNIDKKVEKIVWKSIKKMESLGATYDIVSLKMTKYAIPSYYIIAKSEASTNIAKYCGMRYGLYERIEGDFNQYFSRVRSKGFGEEAKRSAMLGTFARMSGYRDAYYLKAMKVRTLIIQDFKKVFKNHDVIATPTMPILPPKFTQIKKLTPLQHYQTDILTVPANLAGVPMISLPCGSVGKLSVGLHLMGDHMNEGKIIEIASALEGSL